MLQKAELHLEYTGPTYQIRAGKRAIMSGTNHGVLNALGESSGDSTVVAILEMTHPFYTFLDAGRTVDAAGIEGVNISGR